MDDNWKAKVIRKAIIKETYVRLLKFNQRAKCTQTGTNSYQITLLDPPQEDFTYTLDVLQIKPDPAPAQHFNLARMLNMALKDRGWK